ncbi:hypothetical protein COLO4_38128 [Corchorus olitorius]|uniref:DUF4371 domain-containing protein n=1 Tax=Corchorus olitorius TaxID=93759 RepID=A0A1R3FWU0_9ROSI|nr:hypothetical protein COLO4_38128 [Corchorus olitorius]
MLINEMKSDVLTTMLVHVSLCSSRKNIHCPAQDEDLSFLDRDGFVRERFFDIVHVKNAAALTLKNEICGVLSRHNLLVENMQGQGYDGASNMCGEWHGLHALFLNDCPFAYYVHCFAHRLQLALVAALKDEVHVHGFFDKLTSVVNFVGGSCMRQDELQAFQAAEIAHLVAID